MTDEMQPTGEGPAPDSSAARAGWDASAGSPTPAMPTASPNMPNAEHVDAGGAPPQVSQQQQQPQTVPVAVTPIKRGGILGVMDSVADALVGKTRPELGKDPDGNMYVKQHSLTKGEQWMRIAGEGLVGAAAGLKAGRGHGMGAAGLAGVEAGEHLQDKEKQNLNDEISQDDKIMLSNANRQMLRMNLAETTWKASRLSVDAGQKDIEFAQKQEDRLVKDAGGTVLGTVAHPGDISSVLKINPTLAEDMVNHHLIELVPHVGSDGKVAGFKVIKMPQGYREQMLPTGATFHTFDPVTHQVVEHKASDPMTAGDRDDYDAAANLAMMKYKSDAAEQRLKGAQADEAGAKVKESPSIIRKNDAEANRANAEATESPSKITKNDAEAGKADAQADKAKADAGEGPEGEALVDLIGSGRGPVGRLAYLASRNPALLERVAKKYPGFDVTKVEGYTKMNQDFTSGKTSRQLNSGSAALRHMRELAQLNTYQSHIPGTADYNAYQNKADTVSEELAQFYGNSTIPTIAGIKKTLASQLPGTRMAGIRQQAKSMGDKFEEFQSQWNRGVPSEAYKPLMPKLSEESKEARAFLDPAYKKQLDAERQQQPTAPVIGQPQQQSEPPKPSPTAQPMAFSKSAWLRTHQGGDVDAAVKVAQQQGHPVID